MRGLLPLFLALAVLSLASVATAQDSQDLNADVQNGNLLTVASPAPAAPQALPPGSGGLENPDWEFGVGYQLNGDNIFRYHSRFYTSGVNFEGARFFNNWFALEGQVGVGFGKTGKGTVPNNLDAKSVFLGGGPKFAYRIDSHWEPWGHVLVGLEHFRFTQTGVTPEGVILGSNSGLGWLAGSGVDYHINGRTSIRGEGDYLGTDFFGHQHRNFQVVVGAVLNF